MSQIRVACPVLAFCLGFVPDVCAQDPNATVRPAQAVPAVERPAAQQESERQQTQEKEKPQKPVLMQQALTAGMRAIVVKTSEKPVKVRVFANGKDVTGGGEDFDRGGELIVSLKEPLQANTRVTATQEVEKQESDQSDSKFVQPSLDWGRVRAQFWGGTIVGRNKDDGNKFSNADPYLGLTVETAYRSPFVRDARGGLTGCVRRVLLNSDTEFRLTTTATKVKEGETGSGSGTGSGTGTGAAADVSTAVTGARAVMFRGTIYAPIRTASFGEPAGDGSADQICRSSSARLDNLFVAPLFMLVLENPLDAPESGDDPLFESWGVGFRFGHYRLSRSSDSVGETANYITFAWTKLDNFAPGAEQDDDAPPRPWTFYLEGRMRVPGVSFFSIGADYRHNEELQDFRLLFGTTFDIVSLLTKVTARPQ